MNVTYRAKSIDVKSGELMTHIMYVFECDAITQALWAMAYERGWVAPKYRKLDVDGDNKWESECDVMGVFDYKTDTYVPMKRA
jgi:hypothetical protein